MKMNNPLSLSLVSELGFHHERTVICITIHKLQIIVKFAYPCCCTSYYWFFHSRSWILLVLVMAVEEISFQLHYNGCGANTQLIPLVLLWLTLLNVLEKIPFEFSITNVTLLSSTVVGFSYHSNHPSKVVCVTRRADMEEKDLDWNESSRNRFYYHSNRDYCQEVDVSVIAGQDSRLFCRVTDLANETLSHHFFFSSAFSLRCMFLVSFFI